jgi:pectate lyase
VRVDGGSSNLDGTRTTADAWESQTSGMLYVSFLLRVEGVDGLGVEGMGTPILNISQAGSVSRQLLSVNLVNDGGMRAGVLKYPSDSTPVSSAFFSAGEGASLSADGSATVLVVAKYEWVDGADNDVVTLWVNPGNLGGGEDPGGRVSTSSGADGTNNAGRLYINRGPTLSLDELRIGRTWAAVTPTGAPLPRPVFTEALSDVEGIVLRGTNGVPGGAYQVLTSADLTEPLYRWDPLSTNLFDAAGVFASTNPAPEAAIGRYFLVLLGEDPPIGPTAPVITLHPADLAVLAGQDAEFTVGAAGTAPLHYQWYYNTNAPIAGATGPVVVVSGAAAADAGTYHAVVSNEVGAATSAFAALSVVDVPTAGVPDGYATLNGGTTGGAGGTTVTVNNLEDLAFYLDEDAPHIILVQGTINLGGSNVRVRDNKTLIGLGTSATLVGNLKVFRNNNVIIRNLTFTNPSGAGDGDGLTLDECLNVWVDHCTFVDCDDGTLDVTHGADWVTVSWCKFQYTDPNNDHRFSNLVGHSDNNAAQDAGRLHVTFHHNWWADLVHERMPRVRFGRVHCYNNYYHSPGNNYCLRAALESEVLMEANYFQDVDQPWEYFHDPDQTPGKIFETGNLFDNVTGLIPAQDVLSTDADGLNPPPYPYSPDPAGDIPALVTDSAGAGRGPFAP